MDKGADALSFGPAISCRGSFKRLPGSRRGSFFRQKPAAGLFPAVDPFCLKPVSPGGFGRFGWFPVFGNPDRGGNQGFRPEKGPLPVDLLGSFFIGVDYNFIISGNPGRKSFSEMAFFRFGKALKSGKRYPQTYLGIDLVDILSPGSTGTGKAQIPVFPDRCPQADQVHSLIL
jgi:hypothetical protein